MKPALLEIGVESLPARFIAPALVQMEELAAELLRENRLECRGARTFGTPMRLALFIAEAAEKSASALSEVTGPPARLLKDASGAWTPQASGFARSQGVKPEDLVVVKLPKGDFLAARKELPGEAASKVFCRVFPEIVKRLQFPKSLEWEESRFRFGRPIRTLLGLYGKQTLRFEIAGVRSSNKTLGLGALGRKPIAVSSAERYAKLLRTACVIADVEERRQTLLKTLDAAAKRSLGALDKDAELLETVLFLTEHPVAVLCRFDKGHLELPKALLCVVLKTQLKFFPLLGKDGALVPEFIGVRDGVSEGQKEVQEGYERVLQARLSDARFFFARDKATTLEAKRGKLSGLGFQKDLGHMLDKSNRVLGLTKYLCESLRQDSVLDEDAAKAIARLAYCDLVCEVVREFPELQGTMGGVYARAEGLGERVALGLEEFYFPTQAKGPLPTHKEACLVSLAGKVDTLSALFSGGFKPTGSEDPFALRRIGTGVVRILLEKQVRLPVRDLIKTGLLILSGGPGPLPEEKAALVAELEDFLWQRAESLFLDMGYKADEIRSVRESGLDDLALAFQRLGAVHRLRPHPDFASLAQAFKRASNILRQAAAKGPPSSERGPSPLAEGAAANGPPSPDGGLSPLPEGAGPGAFGEVDQGLLAEPEELGLFQALCRTESAVLQRVSERLFEEALRSLVALKPELDLFFDKVLVMAEDESVRANRLALLARLVRVFKSVADISHIQ